MCFKSKFFLKIVSAKFRVRERLFRKLKKLISVSIELAEGLDYLRLKQEIPLDFSIFDGHY